MVVLLWAYPVLLDALVPTTQTDKGKEVADTTEVDTIIALARRLDQEAHAAQPAATGPQAIEPAHDAADENGPAVA